MAQIDQIKLKGLREPSLVTLLLLISFPLVGAVFLTPSLPEIANFFHISPGITQLTITLFLAGYALGQLPYGPLSNKIGRKPAIYIGLVISIIGSLLCALAGPLQQFWILLAARVITALGASVGLMMVFTIVSDYYEAPLARQKLAFVIVAFAIAPGIAVSLGGFFTQIFSWESIFYLEAIYGLIMLFLCSRLPETSTTLSSEPFNLKILVDSYIRRCNNRKLVLCGLIQGCCTSFIYVFAAKAPFMGIHLLDLQPSVYGMLNLIPSIGLVLGAILSHKTAHRISSHRSILLGLLIMLPSTLVMLGTFALGEFNLVTFIAPYFVMNIGIAFAYVNCPAIGTGDAKNKPNASAVLAFLNIGMCVLTVLVLGIIDSQAPLLMPILFLALLVILFPLYPLLESLLKKDHLPFR